MPSIGADELIRKYGSQDAVAEAWIEGKLDGHEQRYAPEVVGDVRLSAARYRIELRRAAEAAKKQGG